jgi:hypothetical protein
MEQGELKRQNTLVLFLRLAAYHIKVKAKIFNNEDSY